MRIAIAAALLLALPVHAGEPVQSFCTAARHPNMFIGKTVTFRAVLVRLRTGTMSNDADNLIVTSAACPDQAFISDTKSLLTTASKQQRFEFVGKLIGGELALEEVVGRIQAPTSPRLMARLVPTSVRPASGRPAR